MWAYWIYNTTGRYPGLWSGDFLYEQPCISSRATMINEAQTQWQRGALINLMYHACPPTTGEPCAWEGGVLSSLTDDQWNELIADGSDLNNNWKARLNVISLFLQDLDLNWAPYNPGDSYWDVLALDICGADGYTLQDTRHFLSSLETSQSRLASVRYCRRGRTGRATSLDLLYGVGRAGRQRELGAADPGPLQLRQCHHPRSNAGLGLSAGRGHRAAVNPVEASTAHSLLILTLRAAPLPL
jgi:hypothetical protein